MFAESERGGATAVMKNESLVMICEIFFNFFVQLVTEVFVSGEVGAIFKVDKMDFGWGGEFGLFFELNVGMVGFGEVEVRDERSGGALNAGDI